MVARYMLSTCVRLSVTSRYCIDMTGRIELVFLAQRLFPPIPNCVIRKFESKSTSFGNFAPNSGLRKFCKSIALSTKLVDGRACRRHLYDNRRVVASYYTSVRCNPLTPLLWFVVDLLYNLFIQLCSSWQDFDWYSALRASSAVERDIISFYLYDAMLAWYQLSSSVCVSVSVSVTSRRSIEMAGTDRAYICMDCNEICVSAETSHGTSIFVTCCKLCLTKVDTQCDKLDCYRSN